MLSYCFIACKLIKQHLETIRPTLSTKSIQLYCMYAVKNSKSLIIFQTNFKLCYIKITCRPPPKSGRYENTVVHQNLLFQQCFRELLTLGPNKREPSGKDKPKKYNKVKKTRAPYACANAQL